MVRRIVLALVLILGALLVPAAAHAATADKLTVLSDWTQPAASSYNAWNSARLNRDPWKSYSFDWSTDYCSASPDKPLGFDFTISCWHHDFGYRNYKDAGAFPANKARLDDMLYADLQRVCATYSVFVRPACYSLAWTYYQAVHAFGSLAFVKKSDIKRAETLIK
ncbi:phospholipase [Actinoplanes sp. NPDC026619]|uniref:phospholipase n=1 Tax=Actinoplanes sp. NPDC026619 TaxID=3155798 RepID=UPI0033DBDEA8